jgi:uncharacterized protein YecE (DUF72 family)
MTADLADVRIGTSGWHYGHWRGPFYPPRLPASQHFAFYVERFDTVEINNSFYRLPEESAFAAWRDATPEDFRFAVKASRFLTHAKKLKDPDQAIERLFERMLVLGPKLGSILFQLPPRWAVNLERLEAFLEALPRGHRYAFEFRDPSWHADSVYALLRRYNAAFCAFHLGGFESPIELTADFAYVRLHGPGGKYQGRYSPAELGRWAGLIGEWRRRLQAVYVYFDNDEAAYAAKNAAQLRRMVLGN